MHLCMRKAHKKIRLGRTEKSSENYGLFVDLDYQVKARELVDSLDEALMHPKRRSIVEVLAARISRLPR
jgi:hypothetical protein